MRPTAPPLGTAPRGRFMLPVTRLRVGRLALLGLVIATTLIGGTVWLLTTKARQFTTPTVDSAAWPVWLRQAQTYPTTEPEPSRHVEATPDPNAALLAKLAALQADMNRQRMELEALKKRPSGTTLRPR